MTVHPAFPTSATEAAPLTVRVVDPLALSPDLAAQWKSAPSATGGGEGFDIENMAAARVSLADHVGEQIAFAFRAPSD
ncbi:MAG: hypothetical protein ACT6RK_21660, partial [Sphingopyxis sp.]